MDLCKVLFYIFGKKRIFGSDCHILLHTDMIKFAIIGVLPNYLFVYKITKIRISKIL